MARSSLNARSTRAWLSAALLITLGGAALVRAQHGAADAPLHFSISGPPKFVRGERIVVDLTLTNRSGSPLRVLHADEGSTVSGKLMTEGRHWGIPDPAVSYATLTPNLPVSIAPGASVTRKFDLTHRVLGFLQSLQPRPHSTRFTLNLTYASRSRQGVPAPTWQGSLGPRTFTFEVTEGGVSREERALSDRLNAQAEGLDLQVRTAAFEERTRAFELLLDRFPGSVLLPLAISGWAAEGRRVERDVDVDRVCRRILSSPRTSPDSKEQAAGALAQMALSRTDWNTAEHWSAQADEWTRAWVREAVRRKQAPPFPTLRMQRQRMAQEKARLHDVNSEWGRRNAARGKLERERRARVRVLEAQVNALPRSPAEKGLILSDREIEERTEAAVKRGLVANGLRYDAKTPVESRESYADRLRIEGLERVLAARQRFKPEHDRREQARREWLGERPTSPLLSARSEVLAKEAELAPFSPEETRKLNAVRSQALRDGEISAEEYQRILAALDAAESDRRRR